MKKLLRIALALASVAAAFAGRAEDANTTNATAVLRRAIRQLKQIGHGNPVTPENAPCSCYGSFSKGCPSLEAHCSDVNGRFSYRCSYRQNADPECAWTERARKVGVVRNFSELDRAPVWDLLDRVPAAYALEDIAKTVGKPYRSRMLDCRNCGLRDMRWEYVAYGRDDYGGVIRHTLTFSFAPNGRCTGWVWQAE